VRYPAESGNRAAGSPTTATVRSTAYATATNGNPVTNPRHRTTRG
jgi:hypothetical protein